MWGGFIRMLGIVAAASSLWLTAGKRFGPDEVLANLPGADGKNLVRRQRVWRRTGEVLSALLCLLFALELVWIAAEHQWIGVGLSVYSVWAYFVLAAICCFLGHLVDFLDRHTDWPWRLLAIGLLVCIASLSGHVALERANRSDTVVKQETTTSAIVDGSNRDEDTAWLDTAIGRLDQNPDGPVVIVTASGGGSRAALAAILSLELIESVLSTDERPACIWLCSGVSGGGIALAAHYYPGPNQASSRQAVTVDFLAPMYRGFLVPFENRGESLTAYWDQYFHWNRVHQTTVGADRPILVFGVSDIDLGRRVMVGFPRLPGGWYSRWTKDKAGDWTTSDKDHAPYSLSSLRYAESKFDIPLTRAVRMSSSFPFGFEPTNASVEVPKPAQATTADVHFLDGGMIDNTGLDSVVAILSKIPQSNSLKAKSLAGQLRSRGIFLIEIDAGAGPGVVANSGPLSRLKQPFGGYNRGVYSAAMRAREDNIEKLRSLLGEENFVHEPIEPTPESIKVSEIMTTLALPKHDIDRLVNAFKKPANQEVVRDAIIARYEELKSQRDPNAVSAPNSE
jgi:hypothetical protein